MCQKELVPIKEAFPGNGSIGSLIDKDIIRFKQEGLVSSRAGGNIPEIKSSLTLASNCLKERQILIETKRVEGINNYLIIEDKDPSLKASYDYRIGTEEDEEGTKMSHEIASSQRREGQTDS